MAKVFEDKMMEILKHSVSLCFDNVKDIENVGKVFIMLWKEKKVSSPMYSYQIDQKWVKKHKASEYSKSMMSATLYELQADLEKLEKLFTEADREFPTVFKAIYFPKTSNFTMNLEYDAIQEKTGEDISDYFDQWVEDNIGKL